MRPQSTPAPLRVRLVALALALAWAQSTSCSTTAFSCDDDEDCALGAACVAGGCVDVDVVGGEGEGEGQEGEGEAGEGEGEPGEGEGEGEGDVGEGEGEGYPCIDADDDGRGVGCVLGDDCNDTDAAAFTTIDVAIDGDGDGYTIGAATPVCAAMPPTGFAAPSLFDDCDDTDPTAFQLLTGATDADDDGATFGAARVVCSGAELPPGMSPATTQPDCNEADPTISSGCGNCFTRPLGARIFVLCVDTRDRNPAATRCTQIDPQLRLASIHTLEENDFIAETRQVAGVATTRTWIGLQEQPAQWVDGTPVNFTHYPNGAPNGGNAGENCVNIVDAAAFWDDDDCSGHPFPYLCATP